MKRVLTAREEAFAVAIAAIDPLNPVNHLDAYRQAWPRTQQWSDHAVEVIASRTLAKAHIAERVTELRNLAAQAAGVTDGRVIAEYARIAFADPVDLHDEQGRMLPVHRMSPAARATIQSIDYDTVVVPGKDGAPDRVETYVRKVRLHSKVTALEALGRYRGLFERDNAQRAPSPFESLPYDVQRLIRERLESIFARRLLNAEPRVVGDAAAGGAERALPAVAAGPSGAPA